MGRFGTEIQERGETMISKIIAGRPNSKFRIGSIVQTKSGIVGKVIGMAEYHSGYEYRIKVPGMRNTMYRKEADLRKPTKTRMAAWNKK